MIHYRGPHPDQLTPSFDVQPCSNALMSYRHILRNIYSASNDRHG